MCINGRCLVTLATGFRPIALAIDSSNVYWSEGFEDDAGSLHAVPISGGANATLVPACVSSTLAAVGGQLYFKCVDWRPLARVATDGGQPEYFSTQTTYLSDAVAADGTYGYAGTNRVPLDGGPPVNLATGGNAGAPYQEVIDSESIYWADGNDIVSVPLDGGTVRTIASGLAQPQHVAVDDTAVYWVTYGNSASVQKTALGGGGPIVTLASALSYPGWLAVDDTNVYVTTDLAIIRIPKNGGALTTLVSNESGFEIAVDATSVYWTDYNNQLVMKLTPK